MADDTSLTPQEVADRLRIAKNTVYELIKRGELKSYKVGRKIRIDAAAVEALKGDYASPAPSQVSNIARPSTVPDNGFVICGQDVILDILASRLERQSNGFRTFRSHKGSYNGLYSLYLREVNVATAHLWDGDSGTYNLPYVKRMIPGNEVTVIHLVKRMQGFYVKRGNPKNLLEWRDFSRDDIVMVNREKGSGVRVLLDEHLRLQGIKPSAIKGYESEVSSHLEAASAVCRGKADLAVGNEKAAQQAVDVDFIPMQQEDYDLMILNEDVNHPPYTTLIDIIRSNEFKTEVESLGGYDSSDMGKIKS